MAWRLKWYDERFDWPVAFLTYFYTKIGIKSPNDDSQRVLLSQENLVDVSNESLHRTQGNDSIEIAGERSPSTSNETIDDSRRESGSVSSESKLIDAQTYRERSKSCRCSGDSFSELYNFALWLIYILPLSLFPQQKATSINDTQGAHESVINERSNKSSSREIQRLPLENGEQNYTEGRVEKSLSDFVKGENVCLLVWPYAPLIRSITLRCASCTKQ